MTDITVSRELLRQVLDALREIAWSNNSKWQSDRAQGMTEPLRAALEQPAPVQEPAAEILPDVIHRNAKKLVFTHHGLSLPVGTKLYTATQPAPVQEQQPAPASKPVLLQCLGCERVGTQEQLSASTDCDCWLHTQPAPVQEPVHKLIYPGGGEALFNRLWHLTCNAVATQSGMRVRTDVMPMREMKEFLDHLCVLVDSPPQPVPAPVQEPIGWSITCNGGHTGNFFPYRETAEATLIELNRKYPTDKRTIEPLFTAQPRKAVKLNPSDIDMLSFSYFGHHPVASMTHAYRAFAQQIEAAVWAKLGVTE